MATTNELPSFWNEIWCAAKEHSGAPGHQSSFNDGAHFVIAALKDAAKDIVRLRKIDDAYDGPWEDEEAFALFNKQISEAYRATQTRWAEIVGEEVVTAMWAVPDCPFHEGKEKELRDLIIDAINDKLMEVLPKW